MSNNLGSLHGFFTKYNVFVRSDNTDELSDQDITYLKNYGIKTVIDLRSENEIKNFPDKLRNVTGIDWYNVDIKKGNKMSRKLISDNDYIELVKYTGDGNSQKKLFDLIANLKEGTVLFHCAAGKDRTGILAMLLLKLVGASDEDIVDNYSVSFDLIKNRPSIRMIMENSIKKYGKQIVKKKYYSSGENIMSVIKYIEDRYGSFENYFLACGISINTLNKIKEKFVG